MQERSGNDVQAQPHAAHDENQFDIADLLERDEALDGLEKDADAQGEQEGAVEEGAEQPGALPAKREILAKLGLLGDLFRESVELPHIHGDHQGTWRRTMMDIKVTMKPTKSLSYSGA